MKCRWDPRKSTAGSRNLAPTATMGRQNARAHTCWTPFADITADRPMSAVRAVRRTCGGSDVDRDLVECILARDSAELVDRLESRWTYTAKLDAGDLIR